MEKQHYTSHFYYFFFQAEDCIRDIGMTGVQTCALPISRSTRCSRSMSPKRMCCTRCQRGTNAEELRVKSFELKRGRGASPHILPPSTVGEKTVERGDRKSVV